MMSVELWWVILGTTVFGLGCFLVFWGMSS